MTIAEYLAAEGMTLTALAKKVRLGVSLLSRWDSGDSVPDGINLMKLVDGTGGKITATAVIKKIRRLRAAHAA